MVHVSIRKLFSLNPLILRQDDMQDLSWGSGVQLKKTYLIALAIWAGACVQPAFAADPLNVTI